MRVRYKKDGTEREASSFNVHSMSEVLTGDDSAPMSELDVLIRGEWKDMRQAFRDKDLIPDNFNERFGEPRSELDRARGWSE
jgi:hypothetical protein